MCLLENEWQDLSGYVVVLCRPNPELCWAKLYLTKQNSHIVLKIFCVYVSRWLRLIKVYETRHIAVDFTFDYCTTFVSTWLKSRYILYASFVSSYS